MRKEAHLMNNDIWIRLDIHRARCKGHYSPVNMANPIVLTMKVSEDRQV